MRIRVLCFLASLVLCAVTRSGAQQLVFVPLNPCRVIDTRVAGGIFDPNDSRDYILRGPAKNYSSYGGNPAGCGIPDQVGGTNVALALALNIVAASPTGQGHFRAFPAGNAVPQSSTINFSNLTPELNIANAVILPTRQAIPVPATNGDVTFTVRSSSAHLVVDVSGYFIADPSGSDHSHFGQLWQGNAEKGLEVSNAGNYGFFGTGSFAGVWGSGSSYGVYGTATANGVKGSGDTNGVFGETTDGTGVRGAAYGGAAGVFSNYNTGNAVYLADANRAAWFTGNVHVAGTLSKAAGSFKIDHPLDPENRYLSHSFVESPDMMNVYNGNAVLDRRGEAVIELPYWFEALNRDFRYQLTPLGVSQPALFVAEKVNGNRFRIGGGVAGAEVSWQVTGIRRDAYAEAHRVQVEEDKPEGERGLYLFPEGFGVSKERSLPKHDGVDRN